MKYLISQQWGNLKGNHAGYPHICNLLQKAYPETYCVIECPPLNQKNRNKTIWGRILKYIVDPYISKMQYKNDLLKRCNQMLNVLKAGDDVFLLEYNMPATPQLVLAEYIKKHYVNVRVIAMTHLTPGVLLNWGQTKNKLLKWDRPVDIHVTLGSSLTEYFKSIGIKESKISTGFHAVDMDYYHPIDDIEKSDNRQITVITMGTLQRNYSMLSEVVKKCPNVNWIICKGTKDVGNLFEGCSNIRLVDFVAEEELRRLMNSADVSLSIFEDTIGSNVITTSMAMGLAMVVSDVGSIHDYCDTNNAIFCDNRVDAFVDAINSLNDKEKIRRMKKSSLDIVRRFSIENTHEWYSHL